MKPIKLYAGLFLLFILGVLAGGLGMGLYTKYQRASFFEGRQGNHLEFVLNRLNSELQLSEEQQKQIRGILEDFQNNMMNLQKKHFPEIDALFKEHRAQIRKVLTEKQNQIFDEIEKRMMQRRPPRPGEPFDNDGPKPPEGRPDLSDGGPPKPPGRMMEPFDGGHQPPFGDFSGKHFRGRI